MTYTTPDLLPCPFCGGEASITGGTAFNPIATVWCDVCHSRGKPESTISAAIAAWNTRAAPRWIPVTERLPEIGVPVIVYGVTPYVCGTLAVRKDDGVSWRETQTDLMIYPHHVTHWMPLPEPPKEVE